jgi:hypothetical protein
VRGLSTGQKLASPRMHGGALPRMPPSLHAWSRVTTVTATLRHLDCACRAGRPRHDEAVFSIKQARRAIQSPMSAVRPCNHVLLERRAWQLRQLTDPSRATAQLHPQHTSWICKLAMLDKNKQLRRKYRSHVNERTGYQRLEGGKAKQSSSKDICQRHSQAVQSKPTHRSCAICRPPSSQWAVTSENGGTERCLQLSVSHFSSSCAS